MRHALRIDANQAQVISALQAAGAIVEIIGQPVDLLVGYQGKFMLVEIKDGAKVKSAQKTTAVQDKFFAKFEGYPHALVNSPESALRALRVLAA